VFARLQNRYVNLTCGATVTAPLFLNLSSPENAAVAGANFGADGRSDEVAPLNSHSHYWL
jgi:hypothetical protein